MTQGHNVTAEKIWLHKGTEKRATKKKNKQKQKRATCLTTLLQNELISDVARFAAHIKPVLNQIRLLTV